MSQANDPLPKPNPLDVPTEPLRPGARSLVRSLVESSDRSPPPSPAQANPPDFTVTPRAARRSPALPRSRSSSPPPARRLIIDDSNHWLTCATFVPRATRLRLLQAYPNQSLLQQDTVLRWAQYLFTLIEVLKPSRSREYPSSAKALFGVNLVSRVHSAESGEEFLETESVYSLKCLISEEVQHLTDGLKNGLKSKLERNSPALGHCTVFLKESHIHGLPRYLTIQFVRIFWKNESNQKIHNLQKVDYPLELDVYDLCSEDLRKALEVFRQGASNGSVGTSAAMSKEGVNLLKGMEMTGIYDLIAVLALKGDSASGHHVAWIKEESGEWIKSFNPIRKWEEVKMLAAGDWPMAYICVYKARVRRPFVFNIFSSTFVDLEFLKYNAA